MASPMGLATPHNCTIQPVSRRIRSGKSHGTCHFQSIFFWMVQNSANAKNIADIKASHWSRAQNSGSWLVERTVRKYSRGKPIILLILRMASPMGLAIFRIRKGQVPWDLPFSFHNYPIQPVSTRFENGKSKGTCHFVNRAHSTQTIFHKKVLHLCE